MDTTVLPKAELHCHLIGVIDRSILSAVEASGHRTLVDAARLPSAFCIECLQDFHFWLNTLAPYQFAAWNDYLPVLRLHLEVIIKHGVVYTEIMISPAMFQGTIDQKLDDLNTFVTYTRKYSRSKTDVTYLFVIPRNLPEDKIFQDTEFYLKAAYAGLIGGVAVVGMDYSVSVNRLFPMLKSLKDGGLGIEVHSGEHTGPEEVAMLLASGLADRIGHGIQAFEEPNVVKQIIKSGVHLEFCPTSNLRTKVVTHPAGLPLRLALDKGMSFSINTDDPGAFGCTITDEFQLAEQHFRFGEAEFAYVYQSSMSARFGVR